MPLLTTRACGALPGSELKSPATTSGISALTKIQSVGNDLKILSLHIT